MRQKNENYRIINKLRNKKNINRYSRKIPYFGITNTLFMKEAKPNVCQESTFKQIFESVGPILRNYLYYKSGDMEGSEDLMQIAFCKLWEKCKKVSPTSAKAFLFKVATNSFLNMIEKKKVRIAFRQNARAATSEVETPQFQIEYNEYKNKVEEAINQLSEGQREVFLLNRMDKMTYAEIAEALGVSVKAVEKRMHKAIVKLRQVIHNL